MELNEGIRDKNALKIVFLAGAPGSGKNYVAQQMFGIKDGSSVGSSGFKMVSFDAIFEYALKKYGLSTDLSNLPPKWKKAITDQYNPNSLYSKCRVLVKDQLKMYMKQGVPIIFDGTGQNVGSYFTKKDKAEEMGYDTYMVYVDTPVETSLKRNAARGRKLPDEIVKKIHSSVKNNKDTFKDDFGRNFITIFNDDSNEYLQDDLKMAANKILSKSIRNPIGREFLKTGVRPKPKPKSWPEPSYPKYTGYTGYHSDTPKFYDPNKKAGDNKLSSYLPKYDRPDGVWKMGKFIPNDPAEKPAADTDQPDTKFKKDITLHNPDTGNDIKYKSALGYPDDHPMHKKAEKIKDEKKGND